MSAIRKRTGGAERGTQTGTQRKGGQQTSPENRASEAKSKEPVREGTPGKMATRFSDREKRSEIIKLPGELDLAEDDLNEAELLDSEIDLMDEDVSSVEGLDQVEGFHAMSGVNPGESFFTESSDIEHQNYELRVLEAGKCKFSRPAWIQGYAATQDADDDFDEAVRCVFEQHGRASHGRGHGGGADRGTA